MAYQSITVERRGAVERLTLNRPETRNAFNPSMVAELSEWAATTAADSSVRAAVIAGAGPAFCAGADVAWMAQTVDYTEARNIEDALATSRMFAAIDGLPVPVVGRLQGAAIGGGVGLAAVCDVVVADEHAVFGFTEVKLGIIPAVISPFVLAKIGKSAARELFLTGRRFSAQHARDIGLVHTVVRLEELDAAVDAIVADLLSGGREALASIKALVAALGGHAPLDTAQITARALAVRRVSAEGQEGLRAFLQKRKPGWSGA